MVDRTSVFVQRGNRSDELRTGEQMLRFYVRPSDGPAKTVTATSKETGKQIVTKIDRVPLFRMRATMADLKYWQLSRFWYEMRVAMWPFWKDVVEAEDLRVDPNAEGHPMPMIKVTGEINEKKGIVGDSEQSIIPDDIAYKDEDSKGSFCYDKATMKTLPLVSGCVAHLIKAFKIQAGNKETTGSQGDGAYPRRLWCPFAAPWTPAEEKEITEYEEVLPLLKSWAAKPAVMDAEGKLVTPASLGKTVYWEFEEVDMSVPRR